ncbi:MAG: COX15/CtaA family protein [Tepidisphaeraceae bacterium]
MLDDALHPDHPPAYRRGLFWSALALAASVFPLIWMGGLVTSHGAGLSVPDWPNSYGYNMVLFPPSQWVGGIFYEHTHRLLGTLSGFLATILLLMAWGPSQNAGARRGWKVTAVTLWLLTLAAGVFAYLAASQAWFEEKIVHLLPHFGVGFGSLALVATLAALCRNREPRRWVRWLTVGVFVAVCIQGFLGGYRVKLAELHLAIVHGIFAELFFALAGVTVVITSQWWQRQAADGRENGLIPKSIVYLAGVTLFAIFCQLVVGAMMRHNNAGLAIPGVLVYGKLLPPMNADALDAINAARAWDVEHLPPTTLAGMWLHFGHRIGAIIVSTLVISLVVSVLRKTTVKRAAGRAAVILLGLLVTQATLGVLTVYWRKPADVASLHVAVGALTLMTTAVLTTVLARQAAWRTVRREAAAPTGRLATV